MRTAVYMKESESSTKSTRRIETLRSQYVDMYYNNGTIKLKQSSKRKNNLITPLCLDYVEISDLAVSCNK